MKQTAGIKTISFTPQENGMAEVTAQIDMPDMTCNLSVLLRRKNYDLAELQQTVVQTAIDKLAELRDLHHG